MINNVDYLNQEYWIKLNPNLHINDPAFVRKTELFQIDERTANSFSNTIASQGYLKLSNLTWGMDINGLAEAVTRIAVSGLSTPFAFVYDEFWLCFYKLHHVLTHLLGGEYKLLPDFWVWRIDPQKNDSGWAPHRDRGRISLFQDGSPKSVTVWIPLTKATPLNGCMYVVPADRDPTYNTDREDEYRFQLPDIRALPGKPGDAFIWNQAVLHWGAHASSLTELPRISMAFEFQRTDVKPFNQPLLEPFQYYEFNSRLRLIGKQVLQYQRMYKLSDEMKSIAESCLHRMALN